MALKITKEPKPEPFISDRALYLNLEKTQVLEEDDPAVRFVLVGEGGTIPADEVEKYGLRHGADGKVTIGYPKEEEPEAKSSKVEPNAKPDIEKKPVPKPEEKPKPEGEPEGKLGPKAEDPIPPPVPGKPKSK